MCHKINGNNEAFLNRIINGANYLIGCKSFKIIDGKLCSYNLDYRYSSVERHRLGYLIFDTPTKQDFEMYIPYYDVKRREYDSITCYGKVGAGMHINSILNKESGHKIEKVSWRKCSGILEFQIFVLFDPGMVVFYDGNVVSAEEFYIPNLDVFNKLINHFVRYKVIDGELGEKQVQVYNEIYSMIEEVVR